MARVILSQILDSRLKGLICALHRAVSNASDCRSRGCKFDSQLSHIAFEEIDHEIISVVILPLLLIQEGQLLVSGEPLCSKYWSN